MNMTRNKRDPKKVALAQAIIDAYNPNSVEDMNDALKDLFGPLFESMLQGEMNNHLGYESNDKGIKQTENRRNGYTKKTLKTSHGEVEIESPRDRDGSFEPVLVPKRKKMFLQLKKRCSQCMPEECRKEIFLKLLKTFMVFPYHMK